MTERTFECLIVGGGPAGATLALLLLRQGIEVALLDDGRALRSGPFETVLAAGQRLLQRVGLLDGPVAGAVADPLRHGAIWGHAQLHWREDGEPGLLLDRARFDQGLRARVRAAGGTVLEGVRWQGTRGSVRSDHGLVRGRLVAIATGRGLVAGLPPPVAGNAATTAITVLGEPAEHDRGQAIVEAVADGWIWSHVPARGAASAAVFVDRSLLHGRPSQQVIRDVLASATGPAGRLRNWRVQHANDATARTRPCDPNRLVLGDAAASIDPLGSQGVEKAVAAAEHAAAAIRTGLEHPDWWPRLLRAHQYWEATLQRAHLRVAGDYYAREQRFLDRPFWRRRQPTAEAVATLPTGPLVLRDGLEPTRVLRHHGSGFIEVDGLRDRATGEELAHVGRVPLRELREVLKVPHTIDDAVAAAGRVPALFVLSPQEVRQAVETLFRRGWLLPASRAAGSR